MAVRFLRQHWGAYGNWRAKCCAQVKAGQGGAAAVELELVGCGR